MDVVTLGETMVVFTPEVSLSMRYAGSFSKRFGGAETNVAIGVTRLGHRAGWISKVGQDDFGKAMVAFVRGEGVDVSQVQFDDKHPTGLYFKEVKNGNNVNVQYYRKDSAASQLCPDDLNEQYIASAKYLHITGITPALSESCKNSVFNAIEIAKKNGVKVIFDPNLRRKLWSEEVARKVLTEIAALSDIILPGVDEGRFMFGEDDPEKLGELFLQLGPSLVIIKVGAKGAYYFTKEQSALVNGFQVNQVIDPVGAGDAFAAGVISGLLNNLPVDEVVKMGNAVGALATMTLGDFEGLPEKTELENFMSHTYSEDIQR
ncbi:sugar kinase [Peribacillus sp. NPDC097225]|uniref:sugar kinase n=1 Tax=Peribacillus sp. NPDC097225 TaxID=3364400 RepID=UPI00380B2D84